MSHEEWAYLVYLLDKAWEYTPGHSDTEAAAERLLSWIRKEKGIGQ